MATSTLDKSKFVKDPATGTTYTDLEAARQNGYVPPVETAASPKFRYTQPPAASVPQKPVYQEVDENQIREQTRKRMQTSIDAIDASFTNLTAQEQVQGQDRAGQTRALNARSGLMGSDFGNAAAEKTTQYNKGQQQYLADERDAKVNSVMQNIEDRANQQIESAKAEAEGTYNRESADYQMHQESARGDLMQLAKSGFNLETMDPSRKEALFKQAGYEDTALGSYVFNSYKPKAEQIDYQFIEQRDGSILAIGQDPMSGQLKREVLQGVGPDVGLVIEMISKYPDAGIVPTDDVMTASQKIQSSRIYKDQVRGPVGSGGGGGPTPQSDPTVTSWVSLIQSGQASISNVPAAFKNAVAGALGSTPAQGNSQATQLAQDALSAINSLETHAGKKSAVGGKGLSSLFGLKSSPIGGTSAAGFVAELDRVKSLLTLPNLTFLKGLGAMSDREFATIQAASASLNRDMPEGDFDKELQRIKTSLQGTVNKLQAPTSTPSPTPTAPRGGSSDPLGIL